MPDTMNCEQCGALIEQDHIAKRMAGRVAGKLLCRDCVAEKIREKQAAAKPGDSAISNSGVISSGTAPSVKMGGAAVAVRPAGASGASGTIAAPTVAQVKDEADVPLSLVSDAPGSGPAANIRSFVKSSLAQADLHDNFKREMVERTRGATRCRTFHSKLTDAALSYMDNQMNEWVDAHPEIHVKFATSTIGLMEAKQHQEPHVILTVFY